MRVSLWIDREEEEEEEESFLCDVLNEVHSLRGIAESGTIELIVDEPQGVQVNGEANNDDLGDFE